MRVWVKTGVTHCKNKSVCHKHMSVPWENMPEYLHVHINYTYKNNNVYFYLRMDNAI